jgi:hypothetical protein
MPEQNFLGAGHAIDVETQLNGSPSGQHLLLGELVLPFVSSDPTGEVRGITDGAVKCWVEGGRAYIGIFSRELNSYLVLNEEAVGTIKPYAGTAADIPRGWYLCDGTNGTFDFRDRFILGTHLVEEVGEITDEQFTVIDDHSDTFTTGETIANVLVQDGVNDNSPANYQHDHDVVVAFTHTVSTDYYPASFKLAFIQKVS